MTFRLVELIGDASWLISEHETEAEALLAAADLCAHSDEERDLYVDGPGITRPEPVGGQRRHRH